jgi:hypothetical protein
MSVMIHVFWDVMIIIVIIIGLTAAGGPWPSYEAVSFHLFQEQHPLRS